MVLFVFIISFFAGSGIYLAKYPPGNNVSYLMYGAGVFFLGFLPFVVEGGVLLGFAKIPST